MRLTCWIFAAVAGSSLMAWSQEPVRPSPAHALAPVAPEPEPLIAMDDDTAFPMLSAADLALLQAEGWNDRVGAGQGVWVSVARQRFHLVEDAAVVWQAPCATALAGTGSRGGSLQTPLGWHAVAEKIGDGAPWGQVFRSRQPTREIWKPGMDTKEDLVLTRILWLDGLEPGRNKGRLADGTLIDSKQRYIYIHGTNGEDVIGKPSSHGCIRLLNDDVITAFNLIAVGTPVLITEE